MDEADRIRLQSEHLGRLLDLYKHHYELFVKGYILYLGIVSAIATLLFRFVEAPGERRLLSVIAAAISILSIASCALGFRWAQDVDRDVSTLTSRLELPPVPLANSRRFAIVLLVLSSLMLITFATRSF